MHWIALVRPDEAGTWVLRTDAIGDARWVIATDSRDEVIAEARSRLAPGLRCVVYEIRPELRHLTSVSQFPVDAPIADHRFTFVPGVARAELVAAEEQLGVPIPPRWRDYLTSPSHLDHATLDGEGEFLAIFSVADMVDVTNAYHDWVPRCGAVMIAGSGLGSEWLQLDTRAGDRSPVVFRMSGMDTWSETMVQSTSIDEFIAAAESGRFRFRLDAPGYQVD